MRKHRVIGEWIRGLVIVHCCLCTLASEPEKTSKCLTGYMTDVQTWVDKAGGLKLEKDIQHAIDLSANVNPVPMLHQKMTLFRAMQRHVKYLSLARCKLTRVPPIFHMMDTQGLDLADTIEYMTFFGNKFITFSEAGKQYGSTLNATQATEISLHNMYKIREPMLWTSGFKNVKFSRLKELDLRACSIKILAANTFNGMNSLEALYLGENEIYEIDSRAFNTVQNLVTLDISQNVDLDDDGNIKNLDLNFPSYKLSRLTSLNLSYTKLRLRHNFKTLRDFGKSLKSLSVCETGLANLPEGIFNNTSLQMLDLSRNKGILSNTKALRGLENTLQILYAKDIGLQSMDMFQNFTKLEILKLSSNEISLVTERTVKKLDHLKVLDLNMNKLTMWFERTFTYMPKLEILSLIENNINLITEQMIQDIANISYVALSGNFIVCNCHVKDFYKIALMNEDIYNNTLIKVPKNQLYHRGYKHYNNLINSRTKVNFTCDNTCDVVEDGGVFRLLDFGPGAYMCLELPGSKSVPFYVIDGCSKVPRLDYDNELDGGRRKLMILLLIPCVLLPALILFLFRRNIRYCFITLRNSAMIGLINKNDYINDDTIFNYDVFVSYCNEDRGWVLDHLLPHIETDYSISVCLHERDFQVGLSILENIVSCMDRSRSIMLIISQRFLLSQWCQFEMHLAQHRLLETRREDLTLVLLEDIPRRLRPNTLHYLMLTKTYIVWPKQESERALFWKRIKKTLLSQKAKKEAQNVSLA